MSKPPPRLDDARVLRYATLAGRQPFGQTKHVVRGETVDRFDGLAIATTSNGEGFYLFYCDAAWNVITDTVHDSVEDAMDQAEFEFGRLRFRDWRPRE